MNNTTNKVSKMGHHTFGYAVIGFGAPPVRWYNQWWTVGALSLASVACALVGS